MDQACWNAGNASGITGPPHDTRGPTPHKNDPPSLEKKGQPGKEKENNSLCLLFRAYSPINRGVTSWNEEESGKTLPSQGLLQSPVPGKRRLVPYMRPKIGPGRPATFRHPGHAIHFSCETAGIRGDTPCYFTLLMVSQIYARSFGSSDGCTGRESTVPESRVATGQGSGSATGA